MRKRFFGMTLSPLLFALSLACAMLFALCVSAEAQQTKKIPRIGYLSSVSQTLDSYRREAFRQGLYALGYVEGQNIVIEWRYGDEKRRYSRPVLWRHLIFDWQEVSKIQMF